MVQWRALLNSGSRKDELIDLLSAISAKIACPKDNFTAVLYVCETWITRKFVNMVLRRMFGHKREVTKDQRELHNEELHNIYSSPNTIRLYIQGG
jgi:hypothetical protein